MFGLMFSLMTTAVSVVLPLYQSCKSVGSGSDQELKHWVSYWIVYALYQRVSYTYAFSLLVAPLPLSGVVQFVIGCWFVVPLDAEHRVDFTEIASRISKGSFDFSDRESGADYVMMEYVLPYVTDMETQINDLKARDWQILRQIQCLLVLAYNWGVDRVAKGNPKFKVAVEQESVQSLASTGDRLGLSGLPSAIPRFYETAIGYWTGKASESTESAKESKSTEGYAVVDKDDLVDFHAGSTGTAASTEPKERRSWFGRPSSEPVAEVDG
ncbi:unnamed protein product [Kuraishia capsulata CBS 1993]|uniref:Uncharacterized protein n=1 Tax=Kuraishia capsulata CBS 1993 TaxID=1382522 RepID=W6MR80_9ASCO|nr:uncharacterized protein KUCA_T00005219001 [Kuraishia capsulata CBS 1993]CDK29231.1 unnamed protein product [Kuraishia capsulata CBS 1993]